MVNDRSVLTLAVQPKIVRVREEIADVLLYLVRLADKLDIDLLNAAEEKIALNAKKYPADKARGSSRKYNGAIEMRLYSGMIPVGLDPER